MSQLKGFLVVNGAKFGVLGPECLLFGSGKYPDDLEPVLKDLRQRGVEVEGLNPVSGIAPVPVMMDETEIFC